MALVDDPDNEDQVMDELSASAPYVPDGRKIPSTAVRNVEPAGGFILAVILQKNI